VGTYTKLYMIGIWQRQVGTEKIYRFEGMTLLDECGVNSVCSFYSTVFSRMMPDGSGGKGATDQEDSGSREGDNESLYLTIWKVETIENRLLIEKDSDNESDDRATYSTIGYDIESMLELEDADEDEDEGSTDLKSMEEVNLSERELSLSIEKEKRTTSIAEDESNKFYSRVCRFEFREECLYEAMGNLVPIERRCGIDDYSCMHTYIHECCYIFIILLYTSI
jgi:hypothetical protein